jgi:hypothetical protein
LAATTEGRLLKDQTLAAKEDLVDRALALEKEDLDQPLAATE